MRVPELRLWIQKLGKLGERVEKSMTQGEKSVDVISKEENMRYMFPEIRTKEDSNAIFFETIIRELLFCRRKSHRFLFLLLKMEDVKQYTTLCLKEIQIFNVKFAVFSKCLSIFSTTRQTSPQGQQRYDVDRDTNGCHGETPGRKLSDRILGHIPTPSSPE